MIEVIKQRLLNSLLVFIVMVSGFESFCQETNTMIVDWGDNTFAQLRVSFQDVQVSQVSAGYEHTIAILEDGTVLSWGDNTYDQLVVPSGISNPIKVEAGLGHSIVLQGNGRVVAWGFDEFGQTQVQFLTNVKDIAAGDEHSLVLFEDGTVEVIANAQTTYDLNTPNMLQNVASIASGNFHILALLQDGTVVSWGANEFGQSAVPAGLTNIKAVEAGQFHSIALSNDGSITGWGDGSLYSQLDIPTVGNFTEIDVGSFHNLALTDSELEGWGSDRFNEAKLPQVLQGRTISAFSAGFAHNTLVVSNTGPVEISINDTIFVDENSAIDTFIASLNTEDPNDVDDHIYTLVNGEGDDDNASFKVFMQNSKRLVFDDLFWGTLVNRDGIITSSELNYEVDSLYTIRIRSTDLGGLSVDKIVIVKIRDVNEDVLSLSLGNNEIEERSAIGSLVGTLSTEDTDLFDVHNYTFVSGNGDDDNSKFLISGDQLLINEIPLYSRQNTYTIRVRSTDRGGLFEEDSFIVRVIPINDEPTDIVLSNASIDEFLDIGSLIGFFSSIDPDPEDTHSYELVSGDGDSGNGFFTIENDALLSASVFDYFEQDTFSIRVRSTDDGLPDSAFLEKIFIVTIISVNEPPEIEDQEFTVKETAEDGTLVGVVLALDEDDFAFEILSGNSDDIFSLNETTGEINVENSSLLDALTTPQYSLRVVVTDEHGLSAQATITISVEYVPLPPIIEDQFFEIEEIIEINSKVGDLIASSPKGNDLTFEIVSGDQRDIFDLSTSGQLTIIDNSNLDARRSPQYILSVRVVDNVQVLSDTASVLISILDVNLAPSNILLDNRTVDEQQPEGTRIGIFSTSDPDLGDIHNYSLVSGEGDEGNPRFDIIGNELVTGEIFDFRDGSNYTIRVRSEDNGIIPLAIEKAFLISIRPLDLPIIPTAITPNGDGFNDNWEIGNLEIYTQSTVEVYDTGGRRVFFSRGYSQPWDGSFNGGTLPVASYYYVINLNDLINTQLKGLISILR